MAVIGEQALSESGHELDRMKNTRECRAKSTRCTKVAGVRMSCIAEKALPAFSL